MRAPHVLLLTGPPGVGKTTALQRIAAKLEGWPLTGFTTEEIRSGASRAGFRLVTFEGASRIIAHRDFPGPPRVGRYGVDVAGLEALIIEALPLEAGARVVLVDEIGKMECLAEGFVRRMRALLQGEIPVVATVAQKGRGFIAEVKAHPSARLWSLTPQNRDGVPEAARRWLEERL